MNNWLYVTITAAVQGVAEFLPISSSGHLSLLSALCGYEEDESLSLSIILHAGSLAAICVFYFKTLWGFLRKENFRLLLAVIAGTVPAGIAGVIIKSSGALEKALLGSLTLTGFGFVITAALLYLLDKTAEKNLEGCTAELNQITIKQALITGCVQAVAIIPGISRSGSTIAAGVLGKIRRDHAATFSFLLAIPAIGGAALLELLHLLKHSGETAENFGGGELALGFLVSAAVSYGALCWLIKLIGKGKLHRFSYYLLPLGLLVIALA